MKFKGKSMLGAIIGDIVGSRFEFNNHKSKDFTLFAEECKVTDDTVMTLAIAKAIMKAKPKALQLDLDWKDSISDAVGDFAFQYMQELGRKYPHCSYGANFAKWLRSEDPEPYNSFGNGAAMRVSPVAFFARSSLEARILSDAVTEVTHDHNEGLKGAEAVTVAIFAAKTGEAKKEIRRVIEQNYYALDFTIAQIRKTYQFNETCQETVPQAIVAFLESHSFEDAIRNAISLGGDSDTLAAITGSIAEAYYGIPFSIKEKALTYLDKDLRVIYDDWFSFVGKEYENKKFKILTKCIPQMTEDVAFIKQEKNKNQKLLSSHFSQVYETIDSFLSVFSEFEKNYPEYHLENYRIILDENNIEGGQSMSDVVVEDLPSSLVLALITGAVRGEHFSDEALFLFLEDDTLPCWLKRLRDIDENIEEKNIDQISFTVGGCSEGYQDYHFAFHSKGATLKITKPNEAVFKKEYNLKESMDILSNFKALHTEDWKLNYHDPYILDGTQWGLAISYKGCFGLDGQGGSNDYPHNWEDILKFFHIDNIYSRHN